MTDRKYYEKYLSAHRLKKCYEIGSPRIQQYLEAELAFMLSFISSSDVVLELGCGYGRVMARIAPLCNIANGIDNSKNNLALAKSYLRDYENVTLQLMDVQKLAFSDNMFDIVIAIQNGISAFKVPPEDLILEALRVTKKGGVVILSSYAEKFWEERLQWFVDQSNAGLLGEIDWFKTRDGIIKCKDSFSATSFYQEDFINLLKSMSLNGKIHEIDGSSVFCIIEK